jgi:hypothetical protein
MAIGFINSAHDRQSTEREKKYSFMPGRATALYPK